MSGNSIEVPVRLSLEQAQSQAEALRRILQESVQPNSTEYKAIISMIERATTQAERLKQTMGESFKTSSGSKKFNSELQKTFDLLATATGRLKDVSGKNLILSPEETARVQEITIEIQKLQDEISNIQAGKIGNFFDDASKEEFKNIQDLAQKLNLDLSNMTFSGLSNKLTKELGKVNGSLEETKQKTKELTEAQAKTEVTTNKDNFINNLIEETKNATFLSKDAIPELRNELNKVFEQYSAFLSGDNVFQFGNINQTFPISDILKSQIKASNETIDKEINAIQERIEKYQLILERFNNINTTFEKGGRGAVQSRQAVENMQAIMRQSGITDFRGRNKGESAGEYKKYLIERLHSEMSDAINSQNTFSQMQHELEGKINEVFANVGKSGIIKQQGAFRDIVKNWLTSSGVDIGSEVTAAMKQMTNGLSIETAFEGLANALTAQFNRQLQETATSETQASAEAEKLKQALETLGGIFKINDGKIEVNKKRLQELAEEQDKVAHGARERLGKSLSENSVIAGAKQQYEQATTALKNYANGLANLESKQKALSNVSNAVTRWMGFYQVLNLTKQAINDMKQHIQELDAVMTQIAVVTNMSQDDLWGQIKQYSEIARQYGVAIKGVYEVSQIYYQQGLNKGDVMGLTTETLKMARIAGLDYSTAADYMTTAIRGFKLEMTDAAHVTDVYSALAAKTASSTEELAVAISKTASSAEAVGSSFEATSAMMATMIATTRESATNIGTALKSVISRYGEMTSDPSKLVDSEGEEMSLNRVDKALQTVGITIHDVNGQFRDFDDVILELGEKWDTLDKNSQRYIATLMAGNRQQSRFLALVGNVDEYKNALEIAQNSEDAGELQTLKTLDSIDAKIERMKVTIQEFYTSAGIQDLYKGILDTITNVIDAANNLPKAFGKIPGIALALGGQLIANIKNVLTLIIAQIQASLSSIRLTMNTNLNNMVSESGEAGTKAGKTFVDNYRAQLQQLNSQEITGIKAQLLTDAGALVGRYASAALGILGSSLSISAMNQYGASKTVDEDRVAGRTMLGSAIASGAGGAISGALAGAKLGAVAGPYGIAIGAAVGGIASALPGISSALSMLNPSLARQVELAEKTAKEAKQESTKKKGEYSELSTAYDKLVKLEQASHESSEAMQEYIDYMNQLGDSYPTLVKSLDELGNSTIQSSDLEAALAEARMASANATAAATKAELDELKLKQTSYADLEGNLSFFNQGRGKELDWETIIDNVNKIGYRFDETNIHFNESKIKELMRESYENLENDERNAISNIINDLARRQGDKRAEFALSNPKVLHSLLYSFQEYGMAGFYEPDEIITGVMQTVKDLGLNFESVFGISESDLNKKVKEYEDKRSIDNFKTLYKYIDTAYNYIHSVNEATQNAVNNGEKSLVYQTLIQDLTSQTSTEENLKKLNPYVNFLANIAKWSLEKQDIKSIDDRRFSSESDSIRKKLIEWANSNYQYLDQFSQIDFSIITNTTDMENKIKEILPNASDFILKYYQDIFEDSTKNIRDSMTTTLTNSQIKDEETINRIKKLYEDPQNALIPPQAISTLQKGVVTVSKMLDNNTTILAQNYLEKLLSIFEYIESAEVLSSDQKIAAFNVLNNIDLTDYDSIQTAIDNLSNLGSEYKDLVELLQGAQQQIVRNTATWAEELYSKAKDTSKEIEDILGNVGKGMSYSSALEEAQKLVNAGVKSNPQDLVTFDNELGQYVLTDEAIQAALAVKREKRAAEIQNLIKQNERMLQLVGIETNENGEEKATGKLLEDVKKFGEKDFSWTQWISTIFEDLNENEIAGLAAKAEEIYSQSFDKNGKFDDNKFSEAIIAAAKAMGEVDETFLNNIDKYSALANIASMDFAGLVSRTTDKNIFKQQLQNYLITLGGKANDLNDKIWSQVLSGNLESLENLIKDYGLKTDFSFSSKLKDSINEANISKYQTAITETLNASTAPISAATAELIEQASKVHQKIEDATFDSISKAIEFLNSIKNSLSIEDYNKSAKEILEKSLVAGETTKKQGSIAQAMNFATSNLDLSSFETLANNFGVKLSNWFNLQTGEVLGEFDNAVSYNKFTGTFDIIGTVDEFINTVAAATGTVIDKETAEYAQLYSDIVDKKITAKKSQTAAISKQIEQMQSLADAKVGDILNVSYLSELLTQPIQNALMAAGVTIQDGMAIIGDNFNLGKALTALTSIDTSGSIQLVNAVETLKDSILSIFSNWTSLISNGISGKLSYAGKNELQQIAKDYLGIELNDSSFTRTKEGLKLSQQAAIELYNTLKNIDKISAQIVFDELNKSLKETNEHYKTINSVMVRIAELNKLISSNKYDSTKIKQYKEELSLAKEIAAVRTTTEDSSFDFMSAELTGALNNAPKYWESWAQAVSVSEQAAKDGYIGWQEFARMVQGVSDLAVQTGQDMQFMGQTILADGTSAAKLIEQGYDALTIDVASGKAVLNLGELFSATGMNFKQGAKGFSKDITKGIRDYAKSQVKMLDGMISMLETIVAMEKLGDIAGESGDENTIEIEDILPQINFNGDEATNIGKFSDSYDKYIKELRKKLDKNSKEYNEQFAEGAKSLKINGISFADIIGMDAEELGKQGKAFLTTYSKIIQAMADAAKNSDWDAAFDVIKSNLESLNFGDLGKGTVQFDFAGTTYEYKEGITLQKVGDNYVVNGTEYSDWDEAKAALKVQGIDGLGDLTLESKKGNVVTFTNKLGVKISYDVETGEYTAKFSDGAAISSDSPEGLNIGISAWAKTIGQSLDSENTNIESKKPVTFTVQQKGVLDTTFILKDGKVAVESSRPTTSPSTIASIIKAGNEYVETTTKQNVQQASGTPAEQEITAKNDQVPQALADNQEKGKESPVTQEVVLTESTVPVQEIIGIIQNLKLQFTGTPDSSGITIPANIPIEGTYYALLTKLILGMAQGKSPDSKDLEALAKAAAQGIDVPTASAIISQLIMGTPKETDKKALEDAANAAKNIPGLESTAEIIEMVLDMQSGRKPEQSDALKTAANAAAQGIKAGSGTADISDLDVSLGDGVVPNTNDVETKARQEVQNMNLGAATGTVNNIIVDAAKAVKTLKSGETVTITGLPDADGSITTLTVTATNKILSDTSGFDTDNASGTAKNFDMAVESYHLEFKKLDESGNIIPVSEIDIPANVLFGGEESLQAYLTNQTDLMTPEIKAVLSDLQELINNNGPYEASINFIPSKGKLELPAMMGYDVDTNWGISTLNKSRQKFQETNDWDITVEAVGGFDNLKAAFLAYKESIEDEAFIIDFKAGLIDEATLNQELYKFITEHSDETLTLSVEADTEAATDELESAGNKIESTTYKISIDANMGPAIATINAANLPSKTIDIYGNYKGEQGGGSAKGNVVLASGNAMASGTKTLMGELGPELVVSHGRYFVAGQNGAEFVDLDKDAIVFNHLQTKSLLNNGKAGRGKAKTNERNAVGMATGNVGGGPAMASASSALATLRHIRAQWQKIASMSVSDLAQKGGGGGGGGGGGKKENNAAWLADVERWYNWLQRIAQLEKDINYEETLRSKIQSDRNVNGKAYVDSLVRQLEATKEEEKYQASLADSQEAYFKKRRKEMNNSAFSKFYTFDEGGQLKYTEKSKLKNGDKGGFAALSDLMATNPDGSTKYTAEQQYNKIKAWGFGNTMLYDSSGKKITDENKKKGKHSDEFFTQSVQAFWDKIESDKEEMQKLRDSIDDANTKVLEIEQKRNELIKEMRDNQMDLEDKIMDALQNKLQSRIDEMQKKRDAYDKANQKFIKGLQDSLAREQDMYQRQEDKTELSKMRRQLAILQRSGGSASSIASLQNDIREREKDQYFDERQAQIDAIQTASDKQLEKMDLQISIAQETLDYQKRMGLLWNEVYKIMGGSEGSILKYLQTYSADFTSLSTLGQEDLTGQWKAQIEEYKRWQQKQQDNEVGQKWNVAKDAIKQSKLYSKVYGTGYEYTNSKGEKVNVDKAAKAEFERIYKNTGDENKARQAATKIYSDAQKQYEKENSVKKQPNKSGDKNNDKNSSKNGNNSKKTTAQLGRYQNKDGKTTFIGWYTLKAGQKTPSAPTISGYKCTNTNSTVPSSGAVAGKTYKVTYTYSKTTAQHGWVVTGTDKNNKRIRQEFSLKNYKDDYSAAIAAQNWINKNKSKAKGTLSMSRYKRGGQVDYTGLAQVDGTPSRPEAFFNAEQTKILKKGLLGNSSRILASTLEEFNSIVASMANGATYNTIDRGSSLVIENASVNMNVQSIANDYDARRAGEQALEQMMRIARKSGTKGVSRR